MAVPQRRNQPDSPPKPAAAHALLDPSGLSYQIIGGPGFSPAAKARNGPRLQPLNPFPCRPLSNRCQRPLRGERVSRLAGYDGM
jgi:hypothetical protein